jgi:hypothetical protein
MSATHTTRERTLDDSILPPRVDPCGVRFRVVRWSRGNSRVDRRAEALRSLASRTRKPGHSTEEARASPVTKECGRVRGPWSEGPISWFVCPPQGAPDTPCHSRESHERLDASRASLMNRASTTKPHREEGPRRSEAGCLLSPQNSPRQVDANQPAHHHAARRPRSGLPAHAFATPCRPGP